MLCHQIATCSSQSAVDIKSNTCCYPVPESSKCVHRSHLPRVGQEPTPVWIAPPSAVLQAHWPTPAMTAFLHASQKTKSSIPLFWSPPFIELSLTAVRSLARRKSSSKPYSCWSFPGSALSFVRFRLFSLYRPFSHPMPTFRLHTIITPTVPSSILSLPQSQWRTN